MAKRKRAERIHKRVRKGDDVYVLKRYNLFPPVLKKYKITGKRCNGIVHPKNYYLYHRRGIISLSREEVYTSERKARHAMIKAYRYFAKTQTAYLNKAKKQIPVREKEINRHKRNIKRLEKKYGSP